MTIKEAEFWRRLAALPCGDSDTEFTHVEEREALYREWCDGLRKQHRGGEALFLAFRRRVEYAG